MKSPTKKLAGSSIGHKTNLHGRIAERLGTSVLTGKILPGEVLPNEASLGASFNVSRTAIREAIKVLTSKGLVEVRRKTGTRIRPRHEWNALDPDIVAWQFSGNVLPPAIVDLLELREIIEPNSARLAAERATPAEVAKIEAALLQMEKAIGKTGASVEADLSFHLAILEATHNSFMRPFGALIQAALRASFRQTNRDPEAYQRSLARHRAVFSAIQGHAPGKAESAMLAVLHGARYDLDHLPAAKPKKVARPRK